jgi:hypothetical protein
MVVKCYIAVFWVITRAVTEPGLSTGTPWYFLIVETMLGTSRLRQRLIQLCYRYCYLKEDSFTSITEYYLYENT